jgi:hypothetical protein
MVNRYVVHMQGEGAERGISRTIASQAIIDLELVEAADLEAAPRYTVTEDVIMLLAEALDISREEWFNIYVGSDEPMTAESANMALLGGGAIERDYDAVIPVPGNDDLPG